MRYLVSTVAQSRSGLPIWAATGAINLTGSFAIGVVLGLALRDPVTPPYVRLFWATGVLGGFTTFSSFSWETLLLWQSQDRLVALAYAAGSVVAGVAAAATGIWLVRLVAR